MGLSFFNAARKLAVEERQKKAEKQLSAAAVEAEKRYAKSARTCTESRAKGSSRETKDAVRQGRTGKSRGKPGSSKRGKK